MRNAFLIAFVLTTAGTARADGNEFAVGSSIRALRAASADAVTANSLAGGAIEYARALHLPVPPGLAIWADAGVNWGSASGTLFEAMTTDVGNICFTIGGRARYAIWKHLAVGGRVELGANRTSLELADARVAASGHGWGTVAAVASSIDVLALASEHFSLGVRIELGYVKTASVGLTLAPDRPDDGTLKLPMSAASVGHLDLSGPSFGFRAISQF
jgi:hypothetical protein